jgi:hypothetical protein
MIVIVVDKDRDDLECYEEGNVDLLEDTLSILWDCNIVETYFINVKDETWRRLSDDSSVRLNLSEKELKECLNKTKYGMGYIFVYKDGKIKKCLPS